MSHPFSLLHPASGRETALRRAGFSLIEVTLALGIVAFALVGVIGVLPVALNSSRQSVEQNRAAAIADTLYTSFRSQPFNSVGYLDSQLSSDWTPDTGASGRLNFNTMGGSGGTNTVKPFYATFLDVSTQSDQRHLCFTADPLSGGANYLVTMYFNNHPDGLAITPSNSTSNPVPAQANQVELIISPVSHPNDHYNFISIIANRTN